MGRRARDHVSALVMGAVALGCVALAFGMAIALLLKSRPLLASSSVGHLLFSSSWRPSRGEFGFYPYLVGTLWVSGLAMVLGIPICLLTGIYLSEYAGRRLRGLAKPLVDLLAGIPPVVFGLWAVLALVPLVERLGSRMGKATTGYSVLAGGMVLAVMVFPIIISVTEEVLRKVPAEAREASISLGATRWQTT